MPALFGYLCALCLLLSGGYGALSWLAAPEPAHVATKTSKAKQRPYDAQAEIPRPTGPAASLYRSTECSNSDKMISSQFNCQRCLKPKKGGQRLIWAIGPKPRRLSLNVHRPLNRHRKLAAKSRPTRPSELEKELPSTEVSARGKSDRPRSQRTSHRSERKLILMTMRTIRFPDGRQVTRLIPYRGRERVLAFSANE